MIVVKALLHNAFAIIHTKNIKRFLNFIVKPI